MQRCVTAERHTATLHLSADLLEQSVDITLGIPSPLGEVQMAAPLVHVVDHEPRDRRDVRIPGPSSLVGMTVITRTIKRRGDFRIELDVRLNRLRGIDRRVCLGGSLELREHEQTRHDDHNPLNDFE